jgi:upstream activation factor subunit UAF30
LASRNGGARRSHPERARAALQQRGAPLVKMPSAAVKMRYSRRRWSDVTRDRRGRSRPNGSVRSHHLTGRRTMATAKKAAKKSAKKPAAKKTAAKKPAAKKPAAKKAAPKKVVAKKAAAKKPAAKRKPNAAFMKAMTPSGTLAAVIGSSPLPRTEVTKKIWEYIKKNKLQDAVNRRMINADEKLKSVFGGKGKVSMFEMTKLVSNHLK